MPQWATWKTVVFGAALLVAVGCAKAGRYGGIPKPEPAAKQKDPLPLPKELGFQIWRSPREILDIPIVFIPSTAAEWKSLPDDKDNPGKFWHGPSATIPARALTASAEFLPPLTALSFLIDPPRIKIKVPLGLPDPTPHIPSANPPTYAKWELGRDLFFWDKIPLAPGEATFSCSQCHRPADGFTERAATAPHMKRNVLSLINCVYNRRQFWDGRVETLEETIVGDLRNARDEDAGKKHVFPGFINAVKEDVNYRRRIKDVFGIDEPTADAVAKCLATYMRTLLSGNSTFDRAEAARKDSKAARLTEEHFRSAGGSSPGSLERGYLLFTGKARCAICHPANGLFTDDDFHNIGLDRDDENFLPGEGTEEGRILHVAPGLKDSRLIGAYRTPSLRALPRTGPYMHDGRMMSLDEVVAHFNLGDPETKKDGEPQRGVQAGGNSFVAAALLEGPRVPRRLDLTKQEMQDLVLFLNTLNGEPVDAFVTRAPPKSR